MNMTESQVNLSGLPPIPAKNTVAMANFLVLKTIDFINKFYHDAESKLLRMEQRMDKLDTLTLLLEAKLNSIPAELFQNAAPSDSNVLKTVDVPQSSSSQQDQSQTQEYQQPEQQAQPEPQPQLDPEEERKKAEMEELRPQYEKFIKLFKIGVDIRNINQGMQAAGLDQSKLGLFVDLTSRQ